MNDNITHITDVIHGNIYLSEIEREIISTPLFNRLHYVSQTSTVYMTYPSNNSKRFDHSIGTMKLCGDIFYYSMSNAKKETIDSFLKDLQKEMNSILKSWCKKMPPYFKNAYGDDELAKGFKGIGECSFNGGLYKQYIPSNIDSVQWNYYILLFEAIRVCGLLHDIGHPPFSHIVEEGLKKAYLEAPENSSLRKALKGILKKDNELHEEVGNVIFEGICHSVFSSIKQRELEYRYFYILVLEIANDILSEKNKFFKDIHRIIAGAFDGDRLDNINRDAFMTGFAKSSIDYTQVINSMILVGDSTNGYEFCPDIKTLVSVEECFLRRWKNYRCMTHHHRVIRTNYMLRMVVYYLALEFCAQEKGNDVNESIFLPYDISGLWKPIKETSSNKMQIIRFIQWNDNWLMTVLQKQYLEMFLKLGDEEKKTRLYYFLEEIVENKKNYNSLIKRYEDYESVDVAFKSSFSEYLDEASEKYKEFDKKVNAGSQGKTGGTTSNIAGFIKGLVDINEETVDGAFLTSKISQLVSCFLPKTNLFEEMRDDIEAKLLARNQSVIDDCFLVSKKLKTGTDNLLCLYDNCTGTKKRFIDVSHIDETLKMEQSYIPEFYVYVKWNENVTPENDLIMSLRKDIGCVVAEETKKFIENNFMKYLHCE